MMIPVIHVIVVIVIIAVVLVDDIQIFFVRADFKSQVFILLPIRDERALNFRHSLVLIAYCVSGFFHLLVCFHVLRESQYFNILAGKVPVFA